MKKTPTNLAEMKSPAHNSHTTRETLVQTANHETPTSIPSFISHLQPNFQIRQLWCSRYCWFNHQISELILSLERKAVKCSLHKI